MTPNITSTDTTGTEVDGLRHHGSNFLLLGQEPSENAACRHLQAQDHEDGGRIFLSTMSGVDDVLARHGDRSTDPSRFGVVDVNSTFRSTAVSPQSAGLSSTDSPTEPSMDSWLTQVGDATNIDEILSAVQSHIERVADTSKPGELRFCLDSFDPFFDILDAEERVEFLSTLFDYVDEYNGVMHVHVPPFVNPELIDTIAPAFDAIVKTRESESGGVEQSWLLIDSKTKTDWFPLD